MQIINPQTSKGPADWFTGDVHPAIILSGKEPSRVRMGSVHFSPGPVPPGTPMPSASICI